ncbi:hypothetical protein JXB37_08255, partial [candidate division WOR-3 bacterium]|nr:hypothetical protein [candidate division WOR-3 bacterium]
NGRFYGDFLKFEVSPDGNHLIVPDTNNAIFWIDVTTGARVDTITGLGKCWFLRYSGDSTKLVTVAYATPCVAWQVDVATRAVTDQLTVTGYSLSSIDAAANADAGKMFFGTGNNTSTLVDFVDDDFVTFTQTYSAFWVGVSPDHSLAISGQYRFSVIDFATETLRGQHQGNSQYFGAISPVEYRAASFDPHRHEGVYFYDYSTTTPTYRGTTVSGEAPEGDAPHRVKLSPDGSIAIATNVLSDNFTVFNTATMQVETIIPLGDRPQDIAFTSDSRWAVVCGLNGNKVGVLDLSDFSMTEVSVGTGPATVVITPDDSFAYVGNISTNNVSVVRLAGPSSQVVATVPCGTIGIVWGSYGVWSGLGMSPDGRHCLVAASFDDQVKVIETESNTVVAELAVGDFPLCIEFDSTGEYATVTNYLAGTYSVLHVDGSSSSVVGTFPAGQYPMRLAYNRALDQMGIGNYGGKTVTIANPRTGQLINTLSYSSYGALADVAFDPDGAPVVLTASTGNVLGHVHLGSDHVELPAVPSEFDYCPSAALCAVSGPGPDFVTFIDWSPSGRAEVTPVRPRSLPRLALGPSPCRERLVARLELPRAGRAEFELRDAAGRRVGATVARALLPGMQSVGLDTRDLPAGIYTCVCRLDGSTISGRFTVLH